MRNSRVAGPRELALPRRGDDLAATCTATGCNCNYCQKSLTKVGLISDPDVDLDMLCPAAGGLKWRIVSAEIRWPGYATTSTAVYNAGWLAVDPLTSGQEDSKCGLPLPLKGYSTVAFMFRFHRFLSNGVTQGML